jgi:hypothetical protein
VADHAEAQGLGEERRIVPVLEVDARRPGHVLELGTVRDQAVALDRRRLRDPQPLRPRHEAHAEEGAVDARPAPSPGRADGLEADLGEDLSSRLPLFHPVEMETDLLDRFEAVQIGPPFR